MNTCTSCGHENAEDLDFCAGCGRYMRWEVTRLGTSAMQAPGAAPPEDDLLSIERRLLAPPMTEPHSAVDSAVIALRLPGEEDSSGPVTARVEAGGNAAIVALVRNQSGIVDNYDVVVEGLPDGWWTAAPTPVYLVPFGAAPSGFEQEVTVQLHPPRSAEAEAREWPVTIGARSNTRGELVATTPAMVVVAPYEELESELRPERAHGRRKARFAIAVRNRANAAVEVVLSAVDAENACRFDMQQPTLRAHPGRRAGTVFWVRPLKQIWIGRRVEHRFTITPQVVGAAVPGGARSGTFVQKPWLPGWVPVAVPVAVAAAVAVLLLIPKTTTVPDVTSASGVVAAAELLQQAGLKLGEKQETPTDRAKPGAVIRQSIAPGKKVKRGTVIGIEIAVATGIKAVPNIAGKTLQEANVILQKVGFQLGAVTPPTTDPAVKVAGQSPPPGTPKRLGSAIDVFPEKQAPTASGATSTGTAPAAAPKKSGVAVPSLAGLSGAAITAAIAAKGLVPVPVRQFDTTVPNGQVISTDPPAGKKPPADGKVTVVISAGFPDIAYDDGSDVFAIGGAKGQPVKPAAATPADAESEPAWSPGATLLAYVRGSGQTRQIWVANPSDPQSPHPVTNTGFFDHRPAFSPDGKVIAFVRQTGADGDLCFVPAAASAAAPSCIVDPATSVNRPAWAPDGRAILVVRAPTSTSANTELVAYTSQVASAGTAASWQSQGSVTDSFHGPQKSNVFYAAWSPDGKLAAFTADWSGSGFQLFLAPVAQDALGKPVPTGVRACDVAWRPDSKELAVVQADALCSQRGVLARIDPADPQKVLQLANNAENPAWSPVGAGG